MKQELEFRSDLWKKLTSYRRKVVKSLIRKNLFVGKTKKEIEQLLGREDNYYDLDEWAYPVKKNFLGGETYLLLDFRGDQVENLKLHTIYNL